MRRHGRVISKTEKMEGLINMSGLDELKAAYEEIRNIYGYVCKDVILPDKDMECWQFNFRYAGFPVRLWFVYQLYDAPFPENDRVVFWCDDDYEDGVDFSASAFLAITDLVKAFQANRSDRGTMDAFIEYLKKDIHAKE